MKKEPKVSNQPLSDFFGADLTDDMFDEFFDKYFEYLEENAIKEPESYTHYKNKISSIENAISKKSLCKIFCLIIKGINYNDMISRVYYSNNKDEIHNPKVTAIYLKELRDAGIIRRGDKDGRRQLYEIDWLGLFDILRFRNINKISYNEPNENFRISHALYGFLGSKSSELTWLPNYNNVNKPERDKTIKDFKFKAPQDKISEEKIEDFLKEFCFNIFKPYVEEYVNLNLRKFLINIDDPEPHTEVKYLSQDENGIYVDNIDFTIYDVLESFDKEFMEEFPKNFKDDINLHELAKRGLLSDFNSILLTILWHSDSIHVFKHQYRRKSIPNPKYVLLKSIKNEFIKDQIIIDEEEKT